MATKEQKKRKITAEKLLAINGVDYDEWLDEHHKKVIEDDDLMDKLLDEKLTSMKANNQNYSSNE